MKPLIAGALLLLAGNGWACDEDNPFAKIAADSAITADNISPKEKEKPVTVEWFTEDDFQHFRNDGKAIKWFGEGIEVGVASDGTVRWRKKGTK